MDGCLRQGRQPDLLALNGLAGISLRLRFPIVNVSQAFASTRPYHLRKLIAMNARLDLRRTLLPTFLAAFITLCIARAQTPFSLDSASAYLRTIAVDIGPRPMGSPNEQRALEYGANKMREFGFEEVSIMPMKEFGGMLGGPLKNTRSGITIGIHRGSSQRIIVIGAHMDSAGPDIPGANDDGSGAAVVLELARAFSQRTTESTLVFALFAGEEQGLQGSRYFADHFPEMKDVVLMLQIDMANGSDLLLPTLDAKDQSSPEWLVKASYEEFDKLGYSGLYFPTHFFTFMSATPGGGVGSDHEPFLEKNVPAIDFTSDPRDPIHTPQDNYENFKPSGLKRSGDLVYRLVERFDGGVPQEKIGQYYLVQVGRTPLFFPPWSLRVFILLSLMLTSLALVVLRRRRPPVDRMVRPKIPGLKLFLLMLIIQCCVWFSENVVSLIKGVRHPWVADLTGYFILGFLGACIGIWICLQLAPKLNLRRDGYSYYLRSVIFLLIIFIPASFSSYKVALYPATAFFFLALAILIRQPALKVLLWLLSSYFMYRFFFSENFEFLARFAYSTPTVSASTSFILHLVYILFFSFWSFPFLLGFAAIYFDSQKNLLWLRRLRRREGILAAGLAFVLLVAVLSTQPSYSQYWKPNVWIQQIFDADSTSGMIIVESPEYLADTRLRFGATDTTVRGRETFLAFKIIPTPKDPWLLIDRDVETSRADSGTTFDVLLKLRCKYRPYTLQVTYSAGRDTLRDVSTPLAFSSEDRSISVQWYSFPDTLTLAPLHFTLLGGDSLTERVEATFVEETEPMQIANGYVSSIINRTIWSKRTVVSGRR